VHVVLAGGGTAGHVEPALALADALRRSDAAVHITALGTARGLETRLVPERGYDLALIPAVPLPRRPTLQLAALPTRLSRAVRSAADVLDRVQADVVVGFGGYVALPAYLAARRRRIPIVVHEANARPGLANRIGARLTTYVAAAMPDCPLPHAEYVGIPLRSAVSSLDRVGRRPEARQAFGLAADLPTLLVFGGSQGARHINQVMTAAAPRLAAASVQVLHATGAALFDEVRQDLSATPSERYVAVPYLDSMELGYAAADLAVCRAGAMTCAELAAVGLPAIYVPLPHGNGEQRLNAQPLVSAGGGLLIDDADLTSDRLLDLALPLLSDPGRLAEMSAAAARFGRRDADELLADMVRRAADSGS
jgi:UDP-N-acetylglucosamine--N-acetylmuramyl-(pentapeptide) pyrophosphoryl-undecaprenol N-acetylglucosamine transferase